MAWYSVMIIILLLGVVVIEAVLLRKKSEIIDGLQKEIDGLAEIVNRLRSLTASELENVLVHFQTMTKRMQHEYDHSRFVTGAQLTRFEREITRMEHHFRHSSLCNATVRSREEQQAINQNSARIRELGQDMHELKSSVQEGKRLRVKRGALAKVATRVILILTGGLALSSSQQEAPPAITDSDRL